LKFSKKSLSEPENSPKIFYIFGRAGVASSKKEESEASGDLFVFFLLGKGCIYYISKI